MKVEDLLPGEYIVAGVGPNDGPVHCIGRPGMTPEGAAIACADDVYNSVFGGEAYSFDVTDHTGHTSRIELVPEIKTVWTVVNG